MVITSFAKERGTTPNYLDLQPEISLSELVQEYGTQAHVRRQEMNFRQIFKYHL